MQGIISRTSKKQKKQKNNPVIEFKCADTTSLDFDIPRKIDRVSSAFSFPSCGRISAHEASCASRDAWVRRSSSLPGKGREVSGRLLCPQPCRRALFSTLGCVLRELVHANQSTVRQDGKGKQIKSKQLQAMRTHNFFVVLILLHTTGQFEYANGQKSGKPKY